MKLFRILLCSLFLCLTVPCLAGPMLLSISPNTTDTYLSHYPPSPSSCKANTTHFQKTSFQSIEVPPKESPSLVEWVLSNRDTLFLGAIGFLYLSLAGLVVIKALRKS